MTITIHPRQLLGLLLIAAALGWHFYGPQIGQPLLPSNKITKAVYVYEKDQGGVPAAVLAGLNRVNREKSPVIATVFEQNSTDGTETPEQYKAPLAEAKKAGLPAFVVMAGDKLHKAVKSPKTADEIWEAVQ